MSDVSVSSVVSALLRHRDDFVKIYEIATQLFDSPDPASAMSLGGDLLKALAPIVKDLLASGSAPDGLMMSDASHPEVCAAMGWDLATVEKIAALVVKLLPLFLA